MSTNKFLQKYSLTKADLLKDLEIISESRELGNLGRKEVFLGKASFSISGDGKELAQAVLARHFHPGDVRSGYYRDQTMMLAMDCLTSQEFFAQVYAHSNLEHEPVTGGRLMNGHFGTSFLDQNGDWLPIKDLKNSTVDISPTAAQMPRLLGLAYASKLYKNNPALHAENLFSRQGNEVAWGTIGNASTAEGIFFETINAAGVLQVPMVISVWDDEYGISVPNKYQMVKSNISEILSGFQRNEEQDGFEIITVKGWDFPALVEAYHRANEVARQEHVPVMVHVTEMTQPFGHSSSGSHERYKSKERLQWEAEMDCILHYQNWLVENGVATQEEVNEATDNGKAKAKSGKDAAWKAYQNELKDDKKKTIALLDSLISESSQKSKIQELRDQLGNELYLIKKHIAQTLKLALRYTINESDLPTRQAILDWNEKYREETLMNTSVVLYTIPNLIAHLKFRK